MQGNPFENINDMPMREFTRLSRFIYEQSAICLPESKRTMLAARIHKRMRALGIGDYRAYVEYVLDGPGRDNELKPLLDCVTTNKTDFFREPDHFATLADRVAAEVLARVTTHPRRLEIWSAGCSSGQEPYTIAMVLEDFFSRRQGDYRILASDLSVRMLEAAATAVYREQDLAPVPAEFRRRYLLQGIRKREGLYRIVPELRRKLHFARINLTAEEGFGLEEKMDIIFCRNVAIYFDRATQVRLHANFYNQLKPGGYLFIGHSESLNGINAEFRSLGGAVYQRPLQD